VAAALRKLKDPHTGEDIVKGGFVRSFEVQNGNVRLVMKAPDGEEHCPQYVPLAVEAKRSIMALPGVKAVEATFTGHIQARAVNEALKMLDEHTVKRRKGGRS